MLIKILLFLSFFFVHGHTLINHAHAINASNDDKEIYVKFIKNSTVTSLNCHRRALYLSTLTNTHATIQCSLCLERITGQQQRHGYGCLWWWWRRRWRWHKKNITANVFNELLYFDWNDEIWVSKTMSLSITYSQGIAFFSNEFIYFTFHDICTCHTEWNYIFTDFTIKRWCYRRWNVIYLFYFFISFVHLEPRKKKNLSRAQTVWYTKISCIKWCYTILLFTHRVGEKRRKIKVRLAEQRRTQQKRIMFAIRGNLTQFKFYHLIVIDVLGTGLISLLWPHAVNITASAFANHFLPYFLV